MTATTRAALDAAIDAFAEQITTCDGVPVLDGMRGVPIVRHAIWSLTDINDPLSLPILTAIHDARRRAMAATTRAERGTA